MKLFRKCLFLVAAFFLLLSSFASPAIAQSSDMPTSWYNQPFNYWFQKVYDTKNPDEIFGERYTAAQVQWIVYSIAALPLTSASDLVNCALTKDAATCAEAATKIASTSNTVAPIASSTPRYKNFWDFFINGNRPISAVAYIKNVGSKFTVVPEAYAQGAPNPGFGFTQLNFIQELWRGFRNIAYLFFVIVTVVFAFMIMFRVKISPQAVITVQSAIPKVVIGLIFVTFSYAIAGLLIDLMYVAIGVVIQIASTSLAGTAFESMGFDKWWSLFTESYGIIAMFFIHLLLFLFSLILAVYGLLFSSITGAILSGLFFLFLVLIFLVIVVIYLFNWARVMWILIKTVANILLAIVISPLQITFGLLSQRGGISSFFKTLISNLIVFPAIALLYILSLIFLVQSVIVSINLILGSVIGGPIVQALLSLVSNITGGAVTISFPTAPEMWVPPFFNEGLMGLVFAGVSFSILLIIPKVVELIQGFMSGKGFDYGTAIAQPIAGAFGVVTYPVRKTVGTVSEGIEKGVSAKIGERVGGLFESVFPPKK